MIYLELNSNSRRGRDQMPGVDQGFLVEDDDEMERKSDLEAADEDERRRRSRRRRSLRIRSLREKAMNASTKLSHTLRKRGKTRVSDSRLSSFVSIEDIRDDKEEEAVSLFRDALLGKDLLPPHHDDYHTMRRFLKARKFDIEKAVHMWGEMLRWRKEYGVDSILQFSQVRMDDPQSFDSLPEPVGVAFRVENKDSDDSKNTVQRWQPKCLIPHITKLVAYFVLKLLAVLHLLVRSLGKLGRVYQVEQHFRNHCNRDIVDPGFQDQIALATVEEDSVHPCLQRLQRLEGLVTELTNKRMKIPPEKDGMLLESLSRIKSIEYDLQKTKKALYATVSKQVELAESLENLKETNIKRRNSCWRRDCRTSYPYEN